MNTLLFCRRRPRCFDLRFDGIEIKARSTLHRREFDRRHREFFHLLLDKDEAPELVFEPVEILLGPFLGSAIGPARSLERIEAEIDQIGYVRLGFITQPASCCRPWPSR